jgi:hypothetical protein
MLSKRPCSGIFSVITGIFLVFSFTNIALTQTVSEINQKKAEYDKLYGLNPWLYSGLRYVPEHPNAFGSPFWKQDEVIDGSLVISGIRYSGLKIQYNLNQQQFILHFTDQNNAPNAIIIPSKNLDTIFIDNFSFVPNFYKSIPEPFIHKLYTGPLSCFLSWKKEYLFYNSGPQTGYHYTNEIRSIYMGILPNEPVLVKNRHDFLTLFEKNT